MNKVIRRVACGVLVLIIAFSNANIAFAIDENEIIESEIFTKELHNSILNTAVDLNDYITDLGAFNDDVLSQLMTDDSNLTHEEGYGYIDLTKYNLPADPDLYEAVCTYIFYDSPELFRVSGFLAELGGVNDSKIVGLRCSYIYKNPLDFVRDYNTAMQTANVLLEGIENNETLNDVEKALLLHDRLAVFCEYDIVNFENDTLPESAYNIYGALGRGIAVCMGYTLAYDYLLERVGIRSQHCSSDLLNHIWNIIYIDGVPYHVDVTWDDMSNDVSGQVFHDNFLRSSKGIKETGHKYGVFNRVDYITTPNNTYYDSFFWQDSMTEFQLLDNKIYYIDSDYVTGGETKRNGSLLVIDDIFDKTPEVIVEITDRWKNVEENADYKMNFSKLAGTKGILLYSTSKSVVSYNPKTQEHKTIITPEEVFEATNDNNYAIYGLRADGCKISGEYSNTPYYTTTTKKENSFTRTVHSPSEWQVVKFATETESGKEVTRCLECNYICDEQNISPLGYHNWGEWYYDSENIPNCEADGIRITDCQDEGCNVQKMELVRATGHDYATEFTIDKAPTYDEVGQKSRHCIKCGAKTEITVIQKLVHSLETPKVKANKITGGIKVDWNEVENADGYTVYRRVYNDKTKKYSGWSVLEKNYKNTTYTDKNVEFGIIYSYTVRAVNADVRSGFKAATGVRVNVTPTVKISTVTNGIKVSWTNVANATGYTVYSASYNAKAKKWSGWTNRGTVKAGTTSWVDKKVKTGTYYKYTVRACRGSFKSSYKASEKLWFLATPNVTAKAASNGVKVSWNKISGAKGYTVYRAEYVNGKWSGWKNMGTIKSTSTVSWTDKSAKKGVYYKYTVRAVNGSYRSAYKASSNVKR